MNEIPSDTTGKAYQGVDHLKQLASRQQSLRQPPDFTPLKRLTLSCMGSIRASCITLTSQLATGCCWIAIQQAYDCSQSQVVELANSRLLTRSSIQSS